MTLDETKCKGCTTCIKHCPTEAIRVRNGRAAIIHERCIDCGNCVRVCPHHAKVAVSDALDDMRRYKYTVALPAPALYAQFSNLKDSRIVLRALLSLGFSEVYEPARAAEMISQLTAKKLESQNPGRPRPLISSACPCVTRLIALRFPNLIPNIMDYMAPVELAAILARETAVLNSGLEPREIGVFFITPCPAKVTETHEPRGLFAPVIDHAVSVAEVYKKLLPRMKHDADLNLHDTAGFVGIGWAAAGGESAAQGDTHFIAADGIESVIKILSDIEDGKYPEAEFLELNACDQGCVGGCFTVENPYAAKARVRALIRASRPKTAYGGRSLSTLRELPITERQAKRGRKLIPAPPLKLDTDFAKALQKMRGMEALIAKLPGLDCGACGTPCCRALAEDVALGFARETDCIFLAENVYLPPPFRKPIEKEEYNI